MVAKKPRILTGTGTVTKNERMPELRKPNYRNPGGLDKPRVVKPRKTAVPMPIRTPVGKPLIRKYNPKLEPGIKGTKRAPGGPTAPKPKGPSKATPLKPQPSTFDRPVRPLPKRKGTPLRKKML